MQIFTANLCKPLAEVLNFRVVLRLKQTSRTRKCKKQNRLSMKYSHYSDFEVVKWLNLFGLLISSVILSQQQLLFSRTTSDPLFGRVEKLTDFL